MWSSVTSREKYVLGEIMRTVNFALALLLAVTFGSFRTIGQENSKPETRKPATTLKVQVTITETEGEKKLSNLPYSFFIKATESSSNGFPTPWTKVRMGSRIPVYVGKEGGMQYLDVGTNIDARGSVSDDGRFEIALNLERSWVEGDILVPVEKMPAAAADVNSGHFKEPIIRQFKTELNLTMRDGQSIQSTQATDPLSGRVMTITVTTNVVK
jgi:hypothetical protein